MKHGAVMDDERARVIVNVSESSVGEVMGELNRRGAWLDKMINKDGLCIVETRIPIQEVKNFETWLKKAVNGNVQILKDQ